MNFPSPAKRKKLINYCDSEFLLQLGKLDYCKVKPKKDSKVQQGFWEQDDESDCACDRKKKNIKCRLLNYGADVNSNISLRKVNTNELYQCVLGQSSSEFLMNEWTSDEDFADLIQLIMAGMDVNIPNEKTSNPLHVKILQGHETNVDEPGTKVKNAVENIRDILVDLLLDAGEGEVNCSNFEDNEQDPLHLRVANSKVKIMKILLEFGTDTNSIIVNKPISQKDLCSQPGEGGRGVTSSLLSTGSEVNSSFDKGHKPLHRQFRQRLLHSLQLLLLNGHKVNLTESLNKNPLHVIYDSAIDN